MSFRIVRVDMTTLSARTEPLSEDDFYLGGRAFISNWLLEKVEPECDPLGDLNAVVISCGPLAGSLISGANRLSIGGKSPLTHGAKETNAGGVAALHMGKMGIRAIVIEGRPRCNGQSFVLRITQRQATIERCDTLRGLEVYETARELRKAFGNRIGMVIIGPAGEMKMAAAGVAVSDAEGEPGRYCGRGGMGAVLGSKGIKAIVLSSEGSELRRPVNLEKFHKVQEELIRCLRSSPATSVGFPKWGTAEMLDTTHALGGLPTRNFSTGHFEYAKAISAETICNNIRLRGGRVTHACMPGCLIRCSNIYPIDSDTMLSPLEYETIALLGSNCGISDLDEIARLNLLCNDVGIDTIEAGATIGVCMQGGLLDFGEATRAKDLVREIAKGSTLGRILGQGAVTAGKVFAVTPVPAIRGQALAAYEPRAIKGLGVTYCTSPMGADHTAGNTVRFPIDHKDWRVQAEASARAQIRAAVYDSLGLCVFTSTALNDDLTVLRDLHESFCGCPLDEETIRTTARNCIANEIEFNRRAGQRDVQPMPEYFRNIINPASGTTFDVPKRELNRVIEIITGQGGQ